MLRQLSFILIFAGFLFGTFQVASQNKDKLKQLEAKHARLQKEIKQINVLLFSNKKREKSVLTMVEDLNYKISVRRNLIKITNEQANLLTREINANQKEITSLRAQLKQLKEDYANMIVKSYKSKSEQSRVMFLLSSDNFKQAYKRLQYIKQYADYQKEQGDVIKLKTKKLQELNTDLLNQKKDKQKLIEENRLAKRQLETEINEQQDLIASIKQDLNKYNSQVKKKQQEADRIDREIDRLIALAIAASNKKTGNTSSKRFALTPAGKKLAANFEANKGKLPWPVERGVVKVKFGKQPSPIDRTVSIQSKGIRIATEKGAKVKAVFNGEVSGIIVKKNVNPAIMVRHGNYLSIYMNLSKINVKQGDKITVGQEIGEVFTSKVSGESILRFRITKNADNLNPSYWLTKR